jgi:hypothetical protein
LLGARHRRAQLARCRPLLGSTTPITPPADAPLIDHRHRTEALTGHFLRVCPVCHHGQMLVIARLVPTRTAAPILDTS